MALFSARPVLSPQCPSTPSTCISLSSSPSHYSSTTSNTPLSTHQNSPSAKPQSSTTSKPHHARQPSQTAYQTTYLVSLTANTSPTSTPIHHNIALYTTLRDADRKAHLIASEWEWAEWKTQTSEQEDKCLILCGEGSGETINIVVERVELLEVVEGDGSEHLNDLVKGGLKQRWEQSEESEQELDEGRNWDTIGVVNGGYEGIDDSGGDEAECGYEGDDEPDRTRARRLHQKRPSHGAVTAPQIPMRITDQAYWETYWPWTRPSATTESIPIQLEPDHAIGIAQLSHVPEEPIQPRPRLRPIHQRPRALELFPQPLCLPVADQPHLPLGNMTTITKMKPRKSFLDRLGRRKIKSALRKVFGCIMMQ